MVKFVTCIVVTATLFCVRAASQPSMNEKSMFATNEFIAKGGIGVIASGNLYVDLKSAKNELRLSAGNTWTGQTAPAEEAVIFFDNRVLSLQSLPEGFDLSRAIVVSFERDKVRFFDFGKMSGGYYKRSKQN